ncbi:MAG: DUF1349 domain-containing protein [Mixta calida]|jgi:hypothetical protein|uniref:DUF1349 domain-containing protein n=1 Tax=Mixta TaxID=2100764 RepID=UPI0009DE4AF7|nr:MULTISPECIES: DUF1349 domain-containing protein [Mixta]MBS6058612.1 DUF1349 domain-containing protein [Pantoea sp.]POU49312.1 DUF1349 domain-containing protein [Pantoea sp. PSNIH5]POU67464.1 DUF1349 domain-containing protein [Pantoea sp. PSNIH4]POY69021.1 DUF1349 domain-containing protein [Pantoea sp. PSNIH3]HCW47883.1 DUF1349 domain-containing protein [Erwiniaceae bacterium]
MSQFHWINPPAVWREENQQLSVVTDQNTDFWRETWYGFTRFSGHFYGCEAEGDFTFQARIRADFHTLYDQAGIMLLADEQQWLKAGIEYNDGHPAIGSVLTQGSSDWATGPFNGDARDFWMRLTRRGDALRLQYSVDGEVWPLLRLCRFVTTERCQVGVMCCTPERAGLAVTFSEMRLTPPNGKALHDLS